MAERPLRILQISTADVSGGAEKVAWNLFDAFRARGFSSWIAVGHKHYDDPHVLLVPNDDSRGLWARTWFVIGNLLFPLIGKIRGIGRLRHWLHLIGQPHRLLGILRGHETFDFPGIWCLLERLPEQPDIIHGHNLHGDYFDLRALPWLSRQKPMVLSLHDTWLVSGHCAYSLDCDRWRTGCGCCPDLTLYPAIQRDATAFNWQHKRKIYAKSRLYVATPSRWLMQKVEQSILAPAIVESRIIPNGVDLSVFHPANKLAVREILRIPRGTKVILFAASSVRRNVWKDFQTMRAATSLVSERLRNQSLLFIALGEDAPPEQIGRAEVRFVPFQKTPHVMASYYQAADVYVHAARAETWGLTITEALACGTPVVATAVGGIPEQIVDGRTGFLTPQSDARAMAIAVRRLLDDPEICQKFGRAAADHACASFSLDRQVSGFLSWYEEIIQDWCSGGDREPQSHN